VSRKKLKVKIRFGNKEAIGNVSRGLDVMKRPHKVLLRGHVLIGRMYHDAPFIARYY
jgi:hypothetical protein